MHRKLNQYHLKNQPFYTVSRNNSNCDVKSTKQKSADIRLFQQKELDNRNIPSGS